MDVISSILLAVAVVTAEVPCDPFGAAQWIGAREDGSCNPAFRCDFGVRGPLRRAELNICGLGYQISSLNGQRVGERELDPVPSDYRRRVYYSTADVTKLVFVGTNRLEVLLGHGWYDFVERDNWDFDKAGWRDRPKLIASLVLDYEDGHRETVVTDSSWRRIGSPVRYDAVRSGIEEIGPVDELDEPVEIVPGPAGRLMKTDCPPTKVVRSLDAVRLKDLGGGSWLLDFGVMISGRIRLRMRGLSKGDLVKVRYDERVNDDFTPTTNRVIDAYFKDKAREFQTDYYHASGLSEEEFSPRFTYKGFRYVLVTGAKTPIRRDDVWAEELQTAFRTTGSFECSDGNFNELLRMADRSYRANFVNGVPTDCPHREKNGWLGDANLAGEFAAYVYDNQAATLKWLRDVVDGQRSNGEIPGIAPTDTWGYKRYGGTTDETLVHLTGLMARFTGDRRPLAEFYPAIVRNLDRRLSEHVRADGTVDEGIGDWCPAKTRSDNTFVSSALFYGAIRKVAAAARLFGKAEDAARYEARAEQMKRDINRVCYKGGGVYANGTQTTQALALYHGLVPEADRKQALAALVRAIHAADDHVDFGIVGASTVFRVLSENGLSDLAYKMIVQPTAPGYLSWRNRGGTALWEDFGDGFSRCHVMFADFVAWAYAYLAGIRGVEDGYVRFVLAPQPIAALDHVTAKVETPHGPVESSWRREGGKIRYAFTVPEGTQARIRLPGLEEELLRGGRYVRETVEKAEVQETFFSCARPVWPKGGDDTLNYSCRFRGEFPYSGKGECLLRAASAYAYRVKLNGQFAGFGPARAAPGFYRVDTWPLAATNGVNVVEIEASSPHNECFFFPKQSPFLQAEVTIGGVVWLATAENFPAFTTERLRKVPRFAGQRHFLEAYRLPHAGRMLELSLQPPKALLPRGYACPTFEIDDSYRAISRERVRWDDAVKPRDSRSMGPAAGGSVNYYAPSELEANPYYDVQRFKTVERRPATDAERAARSFRITDGEAVTFQGAVNRAGFVRFHVACAEPCRIYLTFDEWLQDDGSIDIFRLTCANTAEWILERAGDYDLELIEPTALKYARILVVGGSADVSAPSVRTYENPTAYRGTFASSDPKLDEIFRAAQRTLAANSADCLTDCPTRERAGWCGDTFFAGKACSALTGNGALEKLFLSNWLMPECFDAPEDRAQLLPAVYPADLRFRNDTYIPNFALWFVLEVEDYARRTGDRAFAQAFRPRLEGVMSFFEKYENADGLLEKLPFWVFVEWSEANKLVQDVNYPSSMHYAAALDAMDRMYGRPDFADKAKRIRARVREQSWTGEWFCDNAVRQPDGTLKLSGKCTENCQYFALYFGVAPQTEFPVLWKRMIEDFGSGRDLKKTWPEIYPANFMFGRCIRAELLSAAGERRRLFDEMRRHFLPMAERTGTLWEHDVQGFNCSCCHGVASVAAVYLLRDVLGVRKVDPVARTIAFEPDAAVPLAHCAADVPVSADETAHLGWRRAGDRLLTETTLPKGWRLAK